MNTENESCSEVKCRSRGWLKRVQMLAYRDEGFSNDVLVAVGSESSRCREFPGWMEIYSNGIRREEVIRLEAPLPVPAFTVPLWHSSWLSCSKGCAHPRELYLFSVHRYVHTLVNTVAFALVVAARWRRFTNVYNYSNFEVVFGGAYFELGTF